MSVSRRGLADFRLHLGESLNSVLKKFGKLKIDENNDIRYLGEFLEMIGVKNGQ